MKQKCLFIPIKNKKDIASVFDSGLKLYSENLLLRYVTSGEVGGNLPWHVLFALPKKKLGAVGRNRLRRICKSALFQAMKNVYEDLSQESPNSYKIIFHTREDFNQIPETQRVSEFQSLINRLLKR